MKLRNFIRSVRGAVLVEAVFVLPILIVLTLGSIQMSAIFFVMNSMSQFARDGARAMAAGADDETGGVLTSCSTLSGTAPDGSVSVEKRVCDMTSIMPGSYLVAANDGVPGGKASAGTEVTVSIQILTNDFIFFDPYDALFGAGFLSVSSPSFIE